MTMEVLVSIRLTKEELDSLDAFAARARITRSEAVRRAVRWCLEHPGAVW